MGASESSRLECACFQYTSGRLAFLFVFSTPASHADAGCLVSLWPKVTKSPAFPFQVLPSPPVPQTTQGFIGWRSAVPGLNKCLELDDEIRSCKGAFARELCWPKQGVHWIQTELLPRGGTCRSPGTQGHARQRKSSPESRGHSPLRTCPWDVAKNTKCALDILNSSASPFQNVHVHTHSWLI